ncbi:S49 family peptidase [Methylorubrum sp. SB2]|uniref:S49 family peptidase n=1 Tax=Methylorubrum subtropicum TaxID=3138812 RepID=UPI00313D4B5A
MTKRFPHLMAAIARRPWALSEDWLAGLVEVVGHRASGGARIDADRARELAESHSQVRGAVVIAGQSTVNGLPTYFGLAADGATVEARSRDGTAVAEASVIAVIGVYGIISQRSAQVDDMSGPQGTSTERVSRSLQQALADPAVKAIVFHHDSPGGSVNGVQELAAEIMAARGEKPIIAQVDSLAASASYWLASVCDEVWITPSGEVGSIGVYMMHRDFSAAAEMDGVKITFVKADDSPFKVEGNQYEPLGEEAETYLRSQVNSFMGDFVGAVAKGRGVPVAKVKADFGRGRTMRAKEAVASGMADGVATMTQTLQRVAKMKPGQSPRRKAEGGVIEHRAAADETGGETRADAAGDSPDGTTQAASDVADEPPAADPALASAAALNALRHRRHSFRQRTA